MVAPGTATEFLIFYRLCQETDSVFLLFLLLSQILLFPTLSMGGKKKKAVTFYFLFLM